MYIPKQVSEQNPKRHLPCGCASARHLRLHSLVANTQVPQIYHKRRIQIKREHQKRTIDHVLLHRHNLLPIHIHIYIYIYIYAYIHTILTLFRWVILASFCCVGTVVMSPRRSVRSRRAAESGRCMSPSARRNRCAVVACKIPREENLPIFFLCAPSPPCCPGSTRG